MSVAGLPVDELRVVAAGVPANATEEQIQAAVEKRKKDLAAVGHDQRHLENGGNRAPSNPGPRSVLTKEHTLEVLQQLGPDATDEMTYEALKARKDALGHASNR